MTETTAPDITTAEAEQVASALAEAMRPLLLDAYPVQDGTITVNVWVRQSDNLATMRVTEEIEGDEDEGVEASTAEIDAYLTGDELYHLAMAAGQALAKLGDRNNLVGLIRDLVDELGEMG